MRLIDADSVFEIWEHLKCNGCQIQAKCGYEACEVCGYTNKLKDIGVVQEFLNMIPTVEQKQGKWMKIKSEEYFCSICDYWNNDDTDNYCPHCGAKMVNARVADSI